MRKICITLLLLFILLGKNSGGTESDLESSYIHLKCGQKNSILKEGLKHKMTLEQMLKSLHPENDLLLFGYSHLTHDIDEHEYIYSKAKEVFPELNCLFREIEYNKNDVEVLNSYYKSEIGINELKEQLSHNNYSETDFKIIESAWSRGVKFYPIDKYYKDSNYTMLSLEERNHFMAQKISNNFKAKKCKKGIYLIGARHLSDHHQKNLPTFLNENNITNQSVLLMYAGYNKSSETVKNKPLGIGWTWQSRQIQFNQKYGKNNFLCKENLKVPEFSYGFQINDKNDVPALFLPENYREQGEPFFYVNFSDFDFGYVYICKDPECEKYNIGFNGRL